MKHSHRDETGRDSERKPCDRRIGMATFVIAAPLTEMRQSNNNNKWMSKGDPAAAAAAAV